LMFAGIGFGSAKMVVVARRKERKMVWRRDMFENSEFYGRYETIGYG
jgi:hypothetical protein